MYVPGSKAVKFDEVAPVIAVPSRNHWYPEAPIVAFNTNDPPAQNVICPEFELINGCGIGLTTTVTGLLVTVHPLLVTYVAEYVPLAVTTKEFPDGPLLQLTALTPVGAERVTLPPWQKVVAPDATNETGAFEVDNGVIVTDCEVAWV